MDEIWLMYMVGKYIYLVYILIYEKKEIVYYVN